MESSVAADRETQTVPRAELRAVLTALEWAKEPIDVILDNTWVVDGVCKVLEGATFDGTAHYDLWRRVESEVERLGKHRVKVRWTKGHATEEDIRQGKSSEQDARRNEEADKLVQQGMEGWAIPKWQSDLYLQTNAGW